MLQNENDLKRKTISVSIPCSTTWHNIVRVLNANNCFAAADPWFFCLSWWCISFLNRKSGSHHTSFGVSGTEKFSTGLWYGWGIIIGENLLQKQQQHAERFIVEESLFLFTYDVFRMRASPLLYLKRSCEGTSKEPFPVNFERRRQKVKNCKKRVSGLFSHLPI